MATYLEFFMYCDECGKVTHWAFSKEGNLIHGTCMECEQECAWDSWDKAIEQVEED